MYDPIPDRIIRPSLAYSTTARRRRLGPKTRTIAPNAKVAQLNLTGVHIVDNHEIGPAEVFIVSTVVDGISKSPVTVELNTYKNVGDHSDLGIVPPGVTLYQSMEHVPPFLDWRLLIGESDSGIRDAGALLKELAKDEDWKSITDTLKTALGATNPVMGVIVGLVDELMGVVGRFLEMNRDDQIGYLAVTYHKTLDDLGVGTHKVEVGDAFVKWMIRAE